MEMYSIGEISKAFGLTIRTLQYYDQIGLLKASGRTSGGRRFYTEDNIMKLEQIVFYKSIGLSLDKIEKEISEPKDLDEFSKVLETQAITLQKQIQKLQSCISGINACYNATVKGKMPNLNQISNFIQNLSNDYYWEWAPELLPKDNEIANEIYSDNPEKIFEVSNLWQSIALEAIALISTGEKPSSEIGLKLGKRWCDFIMEATNGQEEMIKYMKDFNEDRSSWPEVQQKLIKESETFLDSAAKLWLSQNKNNYPEFLKDIF